MKQTIHLLLYLLAGSFFYSCETAQSNSIEKTIEEYYQVFNQRQEFERFLDFYDKNIILEDIINGDSIVGKQNLKDFLDWSNPGFERLTENSLVVVDKIIDKNNAVIKGYFTAFKWGGKLFEAMHFTTILTFGKSGKIIKQVDWVNYPSTLINYNERKNSNKWIN
ncbi:nuclear transport factor 2 family protein [Aureispira anguillae]|uniref:SnoaL-like domain-containing protein n=1 Tax=Aureispira anguillae TaxID=2864201 RepID=A0A915YEH1_9BACT|nr:hypothetical protein [Aureispira anguillae]BDS11557.1 hypothetical protein AsAng_0022710 [Aureispira anguillae]